MKKKGELTIFGKGSKERIVLVGSYAMKAISRYLDRRKEFHYHFDMESPLFASRFFREETETHMNRSVIWRILKNCANAASIQKNVSPHAIRRSFATHLHYNGANICVIQDLLGYADISTTQRYIKDEISHISMEFARFHNCYGKQEFLETRAKRIACIMTFEFDLRGFQGLLVYRVDSDSGGFDTP